MTIDDRENQQRADRLVDVLKVLKQQGFKQAQIASELGIPANYLSDLRNNQRVITEPLVRTIASVCGVGFDWLWSGKGKPSGPKIHSEGVPLNESVALPILTEPHTGDPRASKAWDGSVLVLSGRAAAEASTAVLPYILRFAFNDKTGRLRKGDLILVNQEVTSSTDIAVIQTAKRLLLARRHGRAWQAIDTGRAVAGQSEVVGGTLGIVWASL